MIAGRPDARVGVSLAAQKLGIFAGLAHQANELLGPQLRALIVVGHDLADGNARFLDFAVDQEGRDPCVLGGLHGGDGGVGPGIVQDDRLGTLGNGGVEQFQLLVGIVIVDHDHGVIAQLLGPGLGAHGLGLEEWVVMAGGDDCDQPLGRREGRHGGGHGKAKGRDHQPAGQFHGFSSLGVSRAAAGSSLTVSSCWESAILSTGMMT